MVATVQRSGYAGVTQQVVNPAINTHFEINSGAAQYATTTLLQGTNPQYTPDTIDDLEVMELMEPPSVAGSTVAPLPVFQAVGSLAADVAGTTTITRPATSKGDVMFAMLVAFNNGGGFGWTAPTGWNLIIKANNSSNQGLAVFAKRSGASEPTSYGFVNQGTGTSAAGVILDYTGQAPTGTNSFNGGTASPPVFYCYQNQMVIEVYAHDDSSGVFTFATTPNFPTTRLSSTITVGGNGLVFLWADFITASYGTADTVSRAALDCTTIGLI